MNWCGAVDGCEECGLTWKFNEMAEEAEFQERALGYLNHLSNSHEFVLAGYDCWSGRPCWINVGMEITIYSWYDGCTRCQGFKDVCRRCKCEVYCRNRVENMYVSNGHYHPHLQPPTIRSLTSHQNTHRFLFLAG